MTYPCGRSGTHASTRVPSPGRETTALPPFTSLSRSRIATSSAAMVRLAGMFLPFIREVGEVLYEFQAPYVVDWSNFRQAFGPVTPTPHAEAVARTVDWFRKYDTSE